jgi:ATP-binding cassette subfamily B protein/subfamily B ATP-binding cassette protein MsbA
MRNFRRCLRLAKTYRIRLFLSVLCALVAALVWSANFLALHPVLKILGENRSLAESVQEDINAVVNERDRVNEKLVRNRAEFDALVKAGLKSEPEKQRHEALGGQISQEEKKIWRCDWSIYRLKLLKRVYDRLLPADRFHALVWLMLAIVASVAIRGIFEAGQDALVGSVTNLTIFNLRNRLFRSALRLDVHQLSGQGPHDIQARYTNDTEVLGAGLKSLYGKMISEPFKAIGCVGAACLISWQLTVLFLVLVPIGGYIMAQVGHMMKRASKRLMERMSSLHKILNESLHGIRVVKAFTMEPYERRRCRTAAHEFYRRSMRVVYIDAISGPVIELLGISGVMLALAAGAYLVLNRRTEILGIKLATWPMDQETLLTYYALLAAIADPLRKLSSVYTKLHSGAAAADRIMQAIDRKPTIHRNGLGPRLPAFSKSIEFRDVLFQYDPSRTVLSEINLSFQFAQTIAIVGRNGSGKSTLLGLLPRFYEPTQGTVLIDEMDIRNVNLRSLRKQIAIVTQDTILFDDTIANNIAYGQRRAKPEQIEEAARRAFAHEFIEKLPRGYQTPVGELGRSLSGGEKQRLALARAMLRDPRLLILDEFTSQIDAESEVKIQSALREFVKGRTTFIITHRLHTLESVDRVVLLEQGKVEDVGTHSELLGRCELYRRLNDAHFVKRAA